jgi:hypothetical protein
MYVNVINTVKPVAYAPFSRRVIRRLPYFTNVYSEYIPKKEKLEQIYDQCNGNCTSNMS